MATLEKTKAAPRLLVGDALPTVRTAMRRPAASYPPAGLAEVSDQLSERFWPAVPTGNKGWVRRGSSTSM